MKMNQRNEKPNFKAKEWNASGSQFCYGKVTARSFIVDVELADDVSAGTLQSAVDKALERLPYYRYTLVRQKGLYYYAENDLPFLVAESETPRILGSAEVNYHYIDVTFRNNIISFAMFHALCDGLGLNRFIEAVLYHYFCLKDGKEYSSEGIYTDAIPYDPAEEFDVFAEKKEADTQELRQLSRETLRYCLPELAGRDTGPDMYCFPVRILTEDFMKWCKANGASPSSAVTALTMKAVALENEVMEGTVMAVVPFSYRNFTGAEKTFKNCSGAVFLTASPEDTKSKPAGELAADLRTQMKTQINEHFASLLVAGMGIMMHLGKKVPIFSIRSKMMALPEKRPQDTFLVDYVGGLKTNDYSDQITGVSYKNTDVGFGSMGVILSETAGSFHMNFIQTFDNDRYFKSFLQTLDSLEIPYEVLSSSSYLNPPVELPAEQK